MLDELQITSEVPSPTTRQPMAVLVVRTHRMAAGIEPFGQPRVAQRVLAETVHDEYGAAGCRDGPVVAGDLLAVGGDQGGA